MGVSDIGIILSAIIALVSLIKFYTWWKDRKGRDLEEIYNPLHSEVCRIMEQIETFSLPRKTGYDDQKYMALENWPKIRESRLITRIPPKMKKRLKEFYERKVPEYLNTFLTVEKAVRYQIQYVTQLKLERTMREAIKVEKHWYWGDRYSFWDLEVALADVLTPHIIQGKEILTISLDSLDERHLENNLRRTYIRMSL